MVQNTVKTSLASGLDVTDDIDVYDSAYKRLLSEKRVLARIMKRCLFEYRGCDLDAIAEKYIEGTPHIAHVPVSPDETGSFLRGLSQERASPTEGTVLFDIYFDAIVPDTEESVQLIINVEAQAEFYPGYPLLKRGIYYCARMLSAQKETVFTGSHYEKIRKVYSIWVCTEVPKQYQNTITAYNMEETGYVGSVRADKANYDLLSVVMIGLGAPDDKQCDELLRFLNILLSADMSAVEKKRILQDEFDCPMMDIEKDMEVLAMGSPGLALLKKSFEKGRTEGRSEGRIEGISASIRNLMETMNLTLTEAMNALKIPDDERQKYIEELSK
ncbi:MAG: hypothetical protein Q4F00_12485 [bacterium]|nr:hypothetical protein [bacterium]